jgi:2-isopropylmalate synthase
MDLLLINCRLLGWIDNDLRTLPEYVAAAAKALAVSIPHNYPVLGTDAFETGTGVHAAAVIKALQEGRRRARRLGLLGRASTPGRAEAADCGRPDGRANPTLLSCSSASGSRPPRKGSNASLPPASPASGS